MQLKSLNKTAGSGKILKELGRGRIQQWEKTLNGLSIGDHPTEIQRLCSKIIAMKDQLNKPGA